MQGSGAPDLASKARNVGKSQAIVYDEKYDEPSIPETKTRCPCGSSIDDGMMIQVQFLVSTCSFYDSGCIICGQMYILSVIYNAWSCHLCSDLLSVI